MPLALQLAVAVVAAAGAAPARRRSAPSDEVVTVAQENPAIRPAPGAPEQLKLSYAGDPSSSIVVSWISKDGVPTDGSCFDRPTQVWSPAGDPVRQPEAAAGASSALPWVVTTGIKWCSGGADWTKFGPDPFGAGIDGGCPRVPLSHSGAEGVAGCERLCETDDKCLGFTWYPKGEAGRNMTECCFRTGSTAQKPSCGGDPSCKATACYEKKASPPPPPSPVPRYTGSSPPTEFPYPLKPGCSLAPSEVAYGLAAIGGDGDGAAAGAALLVTATNASLLFADHDVDAADLPTNVSTPRAVHVVRLAGLQPASRYQYKVRSAGGAWSPAYTFTTRPVKTESLSLLITADVGLGGIPSSAIADAATGRFDMHLHVGDIAYDMPVDHGAVGDGWSNEESNISRSIPFQVSRERHCLPSCFH
jgi:hypothetical protein